MVVALWLGWLDVLDATAPRSELDGDTVWDVQALLLLPWIWTERQLEACFVGAGEMYLCT